MAKADQSPVYIHSRGLRGLGLATIAAVTAVWAVLAAFAGQVFQRPLLFGYWVGSIAVLLTLGALLEATFRLDQISVEKHSLRWRLRLTRRGVHSIADIRTVERSRTGSARIVFTDGTSLTVGAAWFRRGDIDRLVDALGATTASR